MLCFEEDNLWMTASKGSDKIKEMNKTHHFVFILLNLRRRKINEKNGEIFIGLSSFNERLGTRIK
jgi:hypothetical protein